MKLLIISDVHSDYCAAESIYHLEKPNYVLDCGDHEELKNSFEMVPHFYIHGNHEPQNIITPRDGMPLPHHVPRGKIITLPCEDKLIRVAGLDGNYSSPEKVHSITAHDLEGLSLIPEKGLDILLTHESPLLVSDNFKYKELAERVIAEIERIKPRYVFSGHIGRYDTLTTPKGIINIIVDDLKKGYCVVDTETFQIERKQLRFN